MTLHEAIEKVLKDSGRPMTGKEIADLINVKKLYIRGDKNPVPGSQIHARVKNYPHLFSKNGSAISLRVHDHSFDRDKDDESGNIKYASFTSSIEDNNQNLKNALDDSDVSEKPMENSLNLLSEAVNFKNSIKSFSRSKSHLNTKKNFNELSIDDLFPELINIFKSIGLNQNPEIQVASLVFAYRIITLINEGILPNQDNTKDLIKICKGIDIKNSEEVIKTILSLNKKGYCHGIFDSLLRTINSQFTLDHNLILEILGDFDFSITKYTENKFGFSFYSFLKYFFIDKDKKIHQYSSSNTISKLITGLMKGSLHEGDSIYDPAVGLGGFFIEIKNSISHKEFQTIKFIGDEINNDIASLCRMNLIMNGIYHSEIHTCDSLLSPSAKASSIDISVCEPPFAIIRIFENNNLKVPEYFKIKSNDSASQFLQLINSRLKSEGFAYIVVPEAFFNTSRTLKIRKALISSDLVDYIIDMPMGFGLKSNIKISIIALNKNKPPFRLDRVTFYNARGSGNYQLRESEKDTDETKYSTLADAIQDAQKEGNNNLKELLVNDLHIKRAVIEKERIEKSNYDLSSNLYLSTVSELFEDIVEKEEIVYKLKDLVIDKKFRPVSAKDLNETGTYPFIRIKNLSDSFTSFNLKTTNSNLFNDIKDPIGKLIVTPCVLMAKHGEKLKPTWFDNLKDPIIISESIIPLVINTNLILPEYLFYQLYSEIVSNQLSLIKRGTTIPFYRRTDLLEIKIPVPPISEQINRVAEYKKQEQQKFRLTSFINNIKLIEDPEGIKNEIESFTSKYFPKSDQVLFRTELEFEKFPFTSDDIASGKHISSSYDKLIKHLLIISPENDIHGVVTVSEENDIDFETYSEINAYANFLLKTIQFIRHSNASNILAKFAHSSKNFFVGLSLDIDSLANSKNPELIKQLENLYIDREDFIQRQLANGNSNSEDFLAINKIRSIRNKISKVASFYKKTSTIYKDIAENSPEEFDLVQLIRDSDFNNCVNLTLSEGSFLVYAKKPSIRQAFADLLQNAFQYSLDKKCHVNITDKITYVNIEIQNSINQDLLISNEKYKELGKTWLTKDTGDGASSGLYWAFQAVIDSLGQIELGKYEDYVKNSIFKIEIKLRKKL